MKANLLQYLSRSAGHLFSLLIGLCLPAAAQSLSMQESAFTVELGSSVSRVGFMTESRFELLTAEPGTGRFELGGTFSLGSPPTPEEGPRLSISFESGRVQITWPSAATGYVLQQAAMLNTSKPDPNWRDVAEITSEIGPTRGVSLPADGRMRYFRLRR